jgi:hypothetical protein
VSGRSDRLPVHQDSTWLRHVDRTILRAWCAGNATDIPEQPSVKRQMKPPCQASGGTATPAAIDAAGQRCGTQPSVLRCENFLYGFKGAFGASRRTAWVRSGCASCWQPARRIGAASHRHRATVAGLLRSRGRQRCRALPGGSPTDAAAAARRWPAPRRDRRAAVAPVTRLARADGRPPRAGHPVAV